MTAQAELFFELETANQQSIPLYLVSQEQWQQEHLQLTATEYSFFAVRQFKGALGEHCIVYHPDGSLAQAYVGTGLGSTEQALAHAALLLPAATYQLQTEQSPSVLLYWALAQYRYADYKKNECSPRRLVLGAEQLEQVCMVAQAVFLVRDLVNKPTNAMGPAHLSAVVAALAKEHQAEFKEWVGEQLLESNFPAIHAVGRAAASVPRLITLTWGNVAHPLIALVGKGVCFDSGGLDLKPSSNMRLMKKDMGGAAHVIALAQWIMQRRLPVYLQLFIPAVENAVGPDSFRPGDVLTMRNGLHVEIDNTDAEGRLVLADALAKACEEQPALIIDFATLTGAARTAVGTDIAAMFCNNDPLAAEINAASIRALDPVWRLPLHAPYAELLTSTIADLVNSSPSPYAGAIVAALFLQHFIHTSIPWVHFDVMAWNVANKPGKPEGGEAMGLRTMIEYLGNTYGV